MASDARGFTLRFPIVGFAGKAGCGKNTASAALRARLTDVIEIAFADPLKDALAALGLPRDRWNDRDWKETPLPWLGRSPRYLAQTIGTEWGRNLVDPDVWVKVLDQRRRGFADRSLLIPDVRFPNEARWIHENGGVVVEIIRPGLAQLSNHESETYRLDVDIQIVNDGSLDDLKRHVVNAVLEAR